MNIDTDLLVIVFQLYAGDTSPKWVVGRGLASFVESGKPKTPGLNPGRGQLKVESVAVRSLTGPCGGG
eukprot:11587355-Ditylum_brightwellii.AAC.1